LIEGVIGGITEGVIEETTEENRKKHAGEVPKLNKNSKRGDLLPPF
jgi:hypothetical protein